MTSTLRALFVMDPFDKVVIDRDTTYVLMREAQDRGHEVLACQIGHLSRRGRRAYAQAEAVTVRDDPNQPIRAERAVTVDLDEMDVVWMRKDPPFTIEYVFTTYLLDGVDPSHTLVLNRPTGLREASEKTFILNFPELTPETLVTRSAAEIHRFMAEHEGRCIIKPLDVMGGLGVFLLRQDDPNLSSLIETSTEEGRKHVMVQAYVPEARQGDKRIILIDGEPVGATLRVPPEGELRGNIHVGADCVRSPLTERDRHISATLAPHLRQLGLIFVGIDVLGDYLTEVNVTSPTGVQEINELDGVKLEARMWDWTEEQLG